MPKKVFIVDDADFMVDLLRVLLEDAGYRIVGTATDGLQAVERIRELPAVSAPDIVSVDFHMPKMDGMETIRRVRALVPNVKVLLVSAHATFPVALKAKEVGVDAFVVKPFEPQTVLDTLATLS